jgi:hypothetical protein
VLLWDCDEICKRGTPDVNREKQLYFRCGFGPDEGGPPAVSRPPYPHPYKVADVEEVDVCPAWYFSGEQAPLLAEALDLVDANITLTRHDPAILIEATAIVRRAKRASEPRG